MTRGGHPTAQRQWIRLWIPGTLRGSIRFDLSAEERSVWWDLLAMAGESRSPGIIQSTEGVPYPLPWLAQTLNIPLELLAQTLKRLVDTGRIIMNSECIHVVNFDYYQYPERMRGEKQKGSSAQEREYAVRQCECGYTGPQQPCPSCHKEIPDERIIKE